MLTAQPHLSARSSTPRVCDGERRDAAITPSHSATPYSCLRSSTESTPLPPSGLQPPLHVTSAERESSAWRPEESSSSCNMPGVEDNIESQGTGAQAMAMVPVEQTQEHGKTVAEGPVNEKVVIDAEEKETGKAERKELAPRSEMWQHFIKIKDEKGFLKAGRCKYCHRDIKAEARGHGTSALKKHFNTCKRNPHVFNKDPKQATLQACQGEAPTTWRFDQEALRDAFAEMVIEDEQPFCFGEKPGLKKFLSKACPRLQATSNTFFHEIGEVCLLIQEWLNSEDNLQVSMGKRMKEKFDKYWGVWHTNSKDNDKWQQQEQDRDKGRSKGKGKEKDKEKENINLLIFVAAFLDPRYKLSLYTKITVEEIFGEERGQLVWVAINSCVTELFEEYMNMYAPSEEATPVVDVDKSKRVAGGMLKDKIAKKMKLNNCSTSTNKSELEKYLAEEIEDIESKMDILAWWKVNSARFPVLGHMARDVLAIPITTVASESAFSTGGRILDDFRTSLTPFMLEALVCTQDWLRRPSVDIREIMEELAIIQKEWIEEYGGNGKKNEQPSVTTLGTINTK